MPFFSKTINILPMGIPPNSEANIDWCTRAMNLLCLFLYFHLIPSILHHKMVLSYIINISSMRNIIGKIFTFSHHGNISSQDLHRKYSENGGNLGVILKR